jgi:hypothetical protein
MVLNKQVSARKQIGQGGTRVLEIRLGQWGTGNQQ